MSITAKMVKDLRDKTGAGMMDCKKALTETGGDEEKAIAWLREKGLAKAAKRAGRAASEGVIAAHASEDGKTGALVELKCETDFVAKADSFLEFAEAVKGLVAEMDTPAGRTDIDAAELNDKTIQHGGKEISVANAMKELLVTLGENIQLGRIVRIASDAPAANMGVYVHTNGKIGVLVEVRHQSADKAATQEAKDFAKDVAMQTAATNPVATTPDCLDRDLIEREMLIYKNQAMEEGKPENIAEKIVEGRLKKFYKEVCLIEQPFIKDDKLSIQELLDKLAKDLGEMVEIGEVVRLQLGEDAEQSEETED
jgi:elongation factor Ts